MDRRVQTIIGEITLQTFPLPKRFHLDQDIEFGPQSGESHPRMVVLLVGMMKSLFTLLGEIQDKKT